MKPAPKSLSRGLAAAFLDGPWILDALVERGADAVGRRHRGLRPLARKVLTRFPAVPVGRMEMLAAFIHDRMNLRRVHVRHWHSPAPAMAKPLPALGDLDLPVLASIGDLGRWLGVDSGHLAWYADTSGQLRRGANAALRHYRYTWIPKRSGTYRLLEAPKSRLKTLQRKILREIIDRVAPHDAAHGFRRARSVLSNAAPHTGCEVVVRIDLADFFAAVTASRIAAIFASLGYPDGVARALAGICCTVTPIEVLSARPAAQTAHEVRERHEQRRLLSAPHLPQGAPSSPALANLAAFRLDRRIAGLAAAWGAHYTRYADDLAFSGNTNFAARVVRFVGAAAAIAAEEGFGVRLAKTRIMRRATRQQLAGIVVNVHPGLARGDLERLEAILYNCVRHGPKAQNRAAHRDFRAHLAGRVAWAEHIARSPRTARLRRLFDAIAW